MFDSYASGSRIDFVGSWFDWVSGRDRWKEAEAHVTENIWQPPCDGQDKYYRVTYKYSVEGEVFAGWFSADQPLPIEELVSLRFNPREPKQKYRSGFHSGREPLVLFLISLGAVAFLAVWYAVEKSVP